MINRGFSAPAPAFHTRKSKPHCTGFLIFGLKRPNVLALGDAGLQRAARLLYGEDAELETIGRTAWYLWRHLDAAPAL
jgi:hypothetical protein